MRHLIYKIVSVVIGIFLSTQITLARDSLVLLPIKLSDNLAPRADVLQTALQQGMSQQFTVYSGAEVEKVLDEEAAKVGCTAESCARNTALRFNSELIGDISISSVDGSYIIATQVHNVTTKKVPFSSIESCENCNDLELIRFVSTISQKIASQINTSINGVAAAAPVAALQPLKPLRITTKPENAVVHVNQRIVGTTPITLRNVRENDMIAIKISKTGYKTKELTHVVGKNDRKLSRMRLTPVRRSSVPNKSLSEKNQKSTVKGETMAEKFNMPASF